MPGNLYRFFCLSLLLCFAGTLAAQKQPLVMSIKQRDNILSAGQRLTQMSNDDLEQALQQLSYPFSILVSEVVEEETVEEVEPEVLAPRVVTAAEVMDAFIASHTVTGRMSLGDRDFITLRSPDGQKNNYEEDTLIPYPYLDKTYGIRLIAVTEDDFIFQLGNEQSKKQLEDEAGEAQIQRFNPEP
ncbi:MAG: hypothetical protein AAGA45_04150 [Verrucomicrobiota bacterium]